MNCKRNKTQTVFQWSAQAFVCLFLLGACATQGMHQGLQHDRADAGAREQQVRPADTALVHYQCRLRSGEVVAATDSVAESQRKSNLYMGPKEAGPQSITARSTDDAGHGQETSYVQRSFDEEIVYHLGKTIVGMKEGDIRTVEIKAEDVPQREAPKYIARLTRVRTRPKEMKMPKGDYEYRSKQTAEVGQAYSYDPDFPGRVMAVSDQEVTIRFSATPGAVVETPFGPGRIREEGQDYKMDIDARKGASVRAGVMVGRISDVDDKVITVDFGNPFGGETLLCDVTVEKIVDAKLVQSGK